MADLIQKLADKIAADLFTSGLPGEPRAERLLLWQDSTQRDVGGYGEKPMANRIAKLLREAGIAVRKP